LEPNYNEKTRSRWWYIVPILFGLVGGIIGYFALRKDDPKKAKNCLLLGGILTIINIIVSLSLANTIVDDPSFSIVR
tara:strand:+ start:419 stop:649 length:231 start_codon:yes stop_codon:yes gene_type:complete